MTTTRKLQSEIDRVLKKMQEGIAEFDSIWDKVHSAPTPNLKEKYEGDLKKEIKKLQRHRDQLKSWAASNEVKNKKPLLEGRKLIESKMEQFKVLEKETKTKAYSKEGLNAAMRKEMSKNQDENGPKNDMLSWLDEIYDRLQGQMEEMEEKLSALKESGESAPSGKSKKKGGAASVLTGPEADLQRWINRHTDHLRQLAEIKSRLEDDELLAEQVADVKDDVDYYAENYQDPEYQEDEAIYDSLELDSERKPKKDREDSGEESESDEASNINHEDDEEDSSAVTPASKKKNSLTSLSPSPSIGAGSGSSGNSNGAPSTSPNPASASTSSQNQGLSQSQSQTSSTSTNLSNSSSSNLPKSNPTAAPVISQKDKTTASQTNTNRPGTSTSLSTTVSSPSLSKSPVPASSPTNATPRGPVTVLKNPNPASSSNVNNTSSPSPSTVTNLNSGPKTNIKPGPNDPSVSPSPNLPNSNTNTTNSVQTPVKLISNTPASTSTVNSLNSKPVSSSPAAPNSANSTNTNPPISISGSNTANTSGPSIAARVAAGTTNSQPSAPGIKSNVPVPVTTPYSKPATESLASILSKQKQAAEASVLNKTTGPATSPNSSPSSSPVAAPINSINPGSSVKTAPTPLPVSSNTPNVSQNNNIKKSKDGSTASQPASVPSQSPITVLKPTHSGPVNNNNSVPSSHSTPSDPSNSNSNRSGSEPYTTALSLLERSRQFIPEPSDSQHTDIYIPRNPYRTPSYFPSTPPPIFENSQSNIFEKFGGDTLFFIFYFQQGTPHQYLAGRELKKQSWRYHKNFLTWFQRHDDPITTTDEYEQGTYIYFDYETGWCQRIKSDFTFEYKHLEDEYGSSVDYSTPTNANTNTSQPSVPPNGKE